MQTDTLVLFDFDGTITTQDSLDSFFRDISPNKLIYLKIKFIDTLFYFILYKLKIISLEKLKLKRINKYFSLYDNEKLLLKAINFSKYTLPKFVKNSAIEQIKMHKMYSHKVVVVSASLNILLTEFITSINIELITNDIVYDNKKKIYSFKKPDCNFHEKVIRIKSKYDLLDYKYIYAYGDSNGDYQMLSIANYKYFNYFK